MIATYIIHLQRAVARKANAEALCDQLGPNARIIHAVDSLDLDRLIVEARSNGSPQYPPYPFPPKSTEVATFQSHRACWQQLLDDGHDAALIVEDDIRLEPGFQDALSLAISNLPRGGFVRFPWKRREALRSVVASSGVVQLYRPKVVGLGMLAQIVTRDAARRLLATSEQFDRPVDTFLQLSWVHGVDVMSVWPSGVVEISDALGGSTIHTRRMRSDWLRREILRPAYRLAVSLRSRWARDDR